VEHKLRMSPSDDVDPEFRHRALLDEDEQAIAQGSRDFVYLKYAAEGCETVAELTGMLRSFIGWLEARAREGFELEEPVYGGHIDLIRPEDSAGAAE
jgi:hypothetical protein